MAIANKDFDYCMEMCREGLSENARHVPLLVNLSRALIEKGVPSAAREIAKRAIEINSDISSAWVNVARANLDMGFVEPGFYEEAKEAFERAISLEPEDTAAYVNASFFCVATGDHEKNIEYCREGLKRDPSTTALTYNMGLSLLANYMWEEGWYCTDKNRNSRFPKGEPHFDLPEWNGQPGTVLVYGEQGLGDEIMFSSMIPDLQEHNKVIIDTDERLAGVYERSFGCEVHGDKYNPSAPWKRRLEADYKVPLGSLGRFFRGQSEDFPRKAYLKADPERKLQWRALLDSLSGKPKIGIAWTGGVRDTWQKSRSLSLRDFYPLLEYDCEWISLEYKGDESLPFIHDWRRATRTQDYEDTVALIDELDFIISVTTTVVHCAGALGKEVWCLVPEIPQWRYGTEGDGMLWYPHVKLFRQDKEWPIKALEDKLSAMGIGKCRHLCTKTPITVSPRKNSPSLSLRSLQKQGLQRFLITGLGKAA